MSESTPNALAVLWVTGDRVAAREMVFKYTKNSKLRGWWERVCLIVWGPSASLLAEDEELQALLGEMKDAGVELQACKGCADSLGVTEKLEGLGVDVIYMGAPLTSYIKEGWATLTI